ncbi:FkbM family methyltransferase, partial [Actinocorallia lasiicapitis]
LLARADRVVTVEADPELAALLSRTFPAARVVSAAASDHSGGGTLWSPPGGAIIGISSVEHGAPDALAVPVPTVRLDDLDLHDVRFMKFDIEGHEAAALRGAERTIRRDRPVLLVELEARHGNLEPVRELLAGWDYRGDVGGTPLEEFDLPAHQAAHSHQLGRSFPARALRPGDRYLNSVLFRQSSS